MKQRIMVQEERGRGAGKIEEVEVEEHEGLEED